MRIEPSRAARSRAGLQPGARRASGGPAGAGGTPLPAQWSAQSGAAGPVRPREDVTRVTRRRRDRAGVRRCTTTGALAHHSVAGPPVALRPTAHGGSAASAAATEGSTRTPSKSWSRFARSNARVASRVPRVRRDSRYSAACAASPADAYTEAMV